SHRALSEHKTLSISWSHYRDIPGWIASSSVAAASIVSPANADGLTAVAITTASKDIFTVFIHFFSIKVSRICVSYSNINCCYKKCYAFRIYRNLRWHLCDVKRVFIRCKRKHYLMETKNVSIRNKMENNFVPFLCKKS
uniref:hypothetical protein n=1 Tax=Escherichia sp. MOD1-EC5457 TaxID=2093874 RepID=UPI001A7E144D